MNNKNVKKNKSNRGTIILIIIIFAVSIVGASILAIYQNKKNVKSAAAEDYTSSEDTDSNTVTYNGKEYKLNSDIQTVLFLGVDKNATDETAPNASYSGQSDSILLMVMDQSTKTTTLLQIPRDTMTDVDVYAINGEYIDTEKKQITLQYAYGDGDTKSSWLMKKAVSSLLHDVPINSTFALNMDGIPTITEAMGGVDLTLTEDYTEIDPSYVQGATINLSGDAAERFVRYRDITVTGSNVARMNRQNQFIMALISKMKQKISGNATVIDMFMKVAEPYMTTDLSADDLQNLSSYEVNEPIETIEGDMVAGAEHDEFYVNSDKLQEMVIKLFYKEK